MRHFVIAATLTIATLGAGAAQAGGNCRTNCYQRVDTPPVYGTVAETVEIRPARTYARHVSAVYGSVAETVLVKPGYVSHETVPAQYTTRHRQVMVRPGHSGWAPLR